jgi:hypothetical protein
LKQITTQYLKENPDHIFVFGDNLIGKGKKGAAYLRDEPNTYGFITKKRPSNNKDAFYTPIEYQGRFEKELLKLMDFIEKNPDKTFLISKLGSGLANKHNIWERVIKDGIKELKSYPNVIFLWEVE